MNILESVGAITLTILGVLVVVVAGLYIHFIWSSWGSCVVEEEFSSIGKFGLVHCGNCRRSSHRCLHCGHSLFPGEKTKLARDQSDWHVRLLRPSKRPYGFWLDRLDDDENCPLPGDVKEKCA